MSRFIQAMTGPASRPAVPSKVDLFFSMRISQSLEVDLKSMASAVSSDLVADGEGEPGLLDIGEVAARSGMAPSALRFYESERIIASVERKGLRRQFRPDVMTTLGVVAMCRQAGFTLEEIKRVLTTGGGQKWKAFAARKRDQLRTQAAHLDAIADQLDHALGCPSQNVFDCEHFRAALAESLPVRSDAGDGTSMSSGRTLRGS